MFKKLVLIVVSVIVASASMEAAAVRVKNNRAQRDTVRAYVLSQDPITKNRTWSMKDWLKYGETKWFNYGLTTIHEVEIRDAHGNVLDAKKIYIPTTGNAQVEFN